MLALERKNAPTPLTAESRPTSPNHLVTTMAHPRPDGQSSGTVEV